MGENGWSRECRVDGNAREGMYIERELCKVIRDVNCVFVLKLEGKVKWNRRRKVVTGTE